MAKLHEQPFAETTVIPLAWHVDYWNYLGWEDPYSSARYSKRQHRYAQWLSGSAYTPQMIVNGQEEFVGSNEQKARTVITNRTAHPLDLSLQVINRKETRTIDVELAIDRVRDQPGGDTNSVFCVVTEDDLTTDVTAGENRGKTLNHVGVVRTIKKIGTLQEVRNSGTLQTSIPYGSDWHRPKLNVVAFVQSTTTGRIAGVTRTQLRPLH